MRDLLPPDVLTILSDRYVAGVANAEAGFDMHRADEDAVTGALGQSLATLHPLTVAGLGMEYSITISYRKIRGRGKGAPEKRYGADGLFQLSVHHRGGRLLRVKGLPFQSKTMWRGVNKSLYGQVQTMQEMLRSGVVVDFSPTGYKACTIQAAIAARGSRPTLDRFGLMRPLGQILGHDFLNCTVGSVGLHFDPNSEVFMRDIPEYKERHLITTEIKVSQLG